VLGIISVVNIAMCCFYSYVGGGCTNTALSDKTNVDLPDSAIIYLQVRGGEGGGGRGGGGANRQGRRAGNKTS
jgi:hypothetical protein